MSPTLPLYFDYSESVIYSAFLFLHSFPLTLFSASKHSVRFWYSSSIIGIVQQNSYSYTSAISDAHFFGLLDFLPLGAGVVGLAFAFVHPTHYRNAAGWCGLYLFLNALPFWHSDYCRFMFGRPRSPLFKFLSHRAVWLLIIWLLIFFAWNQTALLL